LAAGNVVDETAGGTIDGDGDGTGTAGATVGAGVAVGVGIGVAPAAVSGAASGLAALSPRPSTADPFGGRSRTTTNPAADAVRAIAGSNRLPSEAAG
jgi:hypothetical protein